MVTDDGHDSFSIPFKMARINLKPDCVHECSEFVGSICAALIVSASVAEQLVFWNFVYLPDNRTLAPKAVNLRCKPWPKQTGGSKRVEHALFALPRWAAR